MLITLLFLLLAAAAAVTTTAAPCNDTCGGSVPVPYPFGFSASCPIRLNCSAAAAAQIGGFPVRNITPHSVLVDVPPACDRPIRPAVAGLFGTNYAMTWRNVIFVRNCSSPSAANSGCLIPTDLLARRFNLSDCGDPRDNITCLSTGSAAGAGGNGFLSAREIAAAGCGYLFTSMGYESGEAAYLPSLAFRTLELGWWVDGGCRCAAGAACTVVRTPGGGSGYRCSCGEGFEGDGFADGCGCRRVTNRCNLSRYMSGSCGGTTRVAALFGGIGLGAAAMFGLALACYLIRRRSSYAEVRKGVQRLLSQTSCTVPLYTYKDIERATTSFSDNQRLGTGAYGTVYAGKLSNDKLVAVKKIKHRDDDSAEQVMNEIKLLSSVSHPNLVRLLGCCIEGGEQILVYEFMPNGTLAQHLQRERGPGLPWTVRLNVATETAKAIAYLHSAIHPPIYHRDIKSSNILLDYSFNSKVADFGLSRIGMMTESSHISTAPQGTPGYLDPQYHQNFHLSDKSDVYSFGVVLVEIITALKVVDFSREQSEVNLAAMAVDKIGKGRVEEIVDPFLEPHRDAWTLSSIYKVAELAFRCLAFDSDVRPSMVEVDDELEQIRLSGWAPAATDNEVYMSRTSSLCSATSYSGTADKSRGGTSKRLQLVTGGTATEVKVDSPVSVHDPWFSEQGSPSSNSLLGNQTH